MKLHYRGKKGISPYTNHPARIFWDYNIGVIKVDLPKGQIHLLLDKHEIKNLKRQVGSTNKDY